jgi:cyclophilin family peptidyl-prolyl cis-trans isomerase
MRLTLSRSDVLTAAAACTFFTAPPRPAAAATAAEAVVTDRVRLEFVEQVNAEERRVLPLTIGLFGNDAPQAVTAFRAACAGQLYAPCPEEADISGEVMERGKQSKKAALRSCFGSASEPVSYAFSQVWSYALLEALQPCLSAPRRLLTRHYSRPARRRIQKGKRIGAGAVQGKFAMRVAPTTPSSESGSLSHDAAGLLSVKRGGGSFDFGITTGVGSADDDAQFAVIGRVIDGLDSLAALDALPVVKAADALSVEAASASRQRACEYSNPQPFCAQGKPLRKVTLMRTAVL